jgi:hypothetical protein
MPAPGLGAALNRSSPLSRLLGVLYGRAEGEERPSKIESKIFGDGSAITKPIADPTAATLRPSFKIMREMSEAFAPRARRIPISWVRWPTEYAMSP